MPKQQVLVKKTANTDFHTYEIVHSSDIDEKKLATLVLNDKEYQVDGTIAKMFITMCDEIDIYYNLFNELKDSLGGYGKT